jgi:hypothetical protein
MMTVDELFELKEDLGKKAFEAFGRRGADVAPETFSEIKERCFQIDTKNEAYRFPSRPAPLNSVSLHVVHGTPIGQILPCSCPRINQ